MSKYVLLPTKMCSKMVPETPLWTLHQRSWDGGCFLCVTHHDGEGTRYKMPYDTNWHWEPSWQASPELDVLVLVFPRNTVGIFAVLSCWVGLGEEPHWAAKSLYRAKASWFVPGKKWDPVLGKAAKLSKGCTQKLKSDQTRQQQKTREQC